MPESEGSFRAPRGTYDLLPPSSISWQTVTRLAFDTFARAGYDPVETPIFEHTEVFERGVGAASELVGKQMYTFEDRGGRSLTLRPEGTAPVVRAVLEHGLDRGALPVKVAYAGPMFRQERPQKGRFRQFWQIGIEAIGSDEPVTDAEVIELGARFLAEAGAPSRLLLNSIGHVAEGCRLSYLKVLTDFLRENEPSLAEEDRQRVSTNPLRTFDSKEPETVATMQRAPVITDHLCDDCSAHFAAVQEALTDVQVDFELAPRLVRGLDYYTRTAFEYVAENLGAQDAVGGGGRYDGLSEALAGPRLPGIGFALGVDRILLARRSEGETQPPVAVYVVAVGEQAAREAFKIATRLRRAGIGTDLDLSARSMKGQMKQADRSGARWAAIVGEQELASGRVTLKDLSTGEQRDVSAADLETEVGLP